MMTNMNKGDNKMNIAGICQYETPCGWCTKWDKKCDKKIGVTMIVSPQECEDDDENVKI